MFKLLGDSVWAFDIEWVPDPVSGRAIYNLPADAPDDDVFQKMWQEGGATEDDPTPFLKTAMCRVVSIAAVLRTRTKDGIRFQIASIPNLDEGSAPEHQVIARFLERVGQHKPQLVGFNSRSSDLVVLTQRALVHGLSQPAFARKPEGKFSSDPDYYARYSDWHVDLKDHLSGFGKGSPSLHELATSAGIPGKLDVDGNAVHTLWHAGNIRKIVEYNECDAITTYLLWLRAAHFSGLISTSAYHAEQSGFEQFLVERAASENHPHLTMYVDAWRNLRALTGRGST